MIFIHALLLTEVQSNVYCLRKGKCLLSRTSFGDCTLVSLMHLHIYVNCGMCFHWICQYGTCTSLLDTFKSCLKLPFLNEL